MQRQTSKEYLRWIHGWGCCVCSNWPVDAHHTVSRARGGSDFTCVPLCHPHHMEGHQIGWKSFERKYTVRLTAVADRLQGLFQDGVEPPHLHLSLQPL